jgi:hypothetical protein
MSEQMTDKQEALYKAKVTAVFKHLRELASKQGVYFSTVMRRVGVTNVYNYENCLSKLGARHIFLMMEKYGIDPNYFFGLSKSMMLKNAKESNDLEDYQKELKSKNMKTSSKNPLEKEGWVSLRKTAIFTPSGSGILGGACVAFFSGGGGGNSEGKGCGGNSPSNLFIHCFIPFIPASL